MTDRPVPEGDSATGVASTVGDPSAVGVPEVPSAPGVPGAPEVPGGAPTPGLAGAAAGSPTARLRLLARRLWTGGEGDAGHPGRHGAGAGAPMTGGHPPEPATAVLATPDEQVPRLLRQLAAWSWRLILVAILIYGIFRLTMEIRLVVMPFIAALLLTALLQPVAGRLRRAGMGALPATWCTFLIAIVIIAGAATLAANRASADYPTLVAEVKRTALQIQRSLAGPPFHLHGVRLQQLTNQAGQFLSQHKSLIAGTVVTGGKIFLEILAGLVLMLFISFFLLKDGAGIWAWLISGLHGEAHRRLVNAGNAAWHAVTAYMRGTVAVAAIHAIFIGVALWILGVPLLVPLIILVFLAAFIPLIGILVVGALIILITLATKGWFAAVIMVAVFLVENQLESHLLQPLVVGRAVRLHPLAIILVLAVGGVIAGIPGAIVAVPTAAVITYAWPFLRGRRLVTPPDE